LRALQNYAESYADNNDLDFEEVFESYWKVKDGSDRDVKVPTERDREIIELYFEEVPHTDVSYSTVNRRLKRSRRSWESQRSTGCTRTC